MKIAIIGPFGIGLELRNGQTIKAQNLVDGLKEYTTHDIEEIDTYGWNRHPFRLFRSIRREARRCDVMIMLPAHNGVKVFSPFLARQKKKNHIKIYYDVIGGWLPDLLKQNQRLVRALKAFDGIWVETATMKNNLKELRFENIEVVPNFKNIRCLEPKEMVCSEEFPLRLCTFSRVVKEKGIETAVNVIQDVNNKWKSVAYSLDIYGEVDKNQKEWFAELERRFPDYIRYEGCVDPDRSTEVLKNYFALLFPTQYYTEGIPGTIIDAYAAGIPVISSRWESFSDLVVEKKTGMGYAFGDAEDLKRVLRTVAENPQRLMDMKEACLEKAGAFSPGVVVQRMMGFIERDREKAG